MLVIEQVLIADLETYKVAAIKGRKDLAVSIYPDSLNYIFTHLRQVLIEKIHWSRPNPPSICINGGIFSIEKHIKVLFFLQIKTFLNNYVGIIVEEAGEWKVLSLIKIASCLYSAATQTLNVPLLLLNVKLFAI